MLLLLLVTIAGMPTKLAIVTRSRFPSSHHQRREFYPLRPHFHHFHRHHHHHSSRLRLPPRAVEGISAEEAFRRSRRQVIEVERPEDLDSILRQWKHRGNPLVVLEVYANWCQGVRPRLDLMSAERPETVFLRMNADDHQEFASKILGVRRLPSYTIYRDGVRLDMFYAQKSDELQLLLEDYQTAKDKLHRYERLWLDVICDGNEEPEIEEYCKWLRSLHGVERN